MSKLAIKGGMPVRKEPFPKRSIIGVKERRAAIKVIDRAIKNHTSFDRYGGTEVDAFEREFAALMNDNYI